MGHPVRLIFAYISDQWVATWDTAELFFGGRVEILVNNAGVVSPVNWRLMLDVNMGGLSIGESGRGCPVDARPSSKQQTCKTGGCRDDAGCGADGSQQGRAGRDCGAGEVDPIPVQL